ncbi:ribonuclease Z [Clostridium tetani]|uniref:ribonuclease Z n=1 Tax=Clostridium tetani TaxID=1513 RepID=UPI00100C0D27|nr:ribonuclease Z [Clostridium tetani]RXI47262.1 ribonuclease Z [Clostridium tetani]RXM62334.1 ribonuclease Z [Clostridium tetani]RXM68857.1 ribonuclease Z [Clostridium tetani]
MIDITLLGTGGGMPTPERNLSAAILNYKGRKILMDCGEGTQVSMKIAKTGFKNIDIICITHWHGDHIVGLPGLLATMGNSGRKEPLTIIGPVGIGEIIKGLTLIVPYIPYELNIIESKKESLNFTINKENLSLSSKGEIIVNTLEVEHSSPCIAYRFDVKRKPKFNLEKALENKVPKVIWNLLQKGENVEFEENLYEPSMVLGEERKGIKFSFVTDTLPIPKLIPFVKKSDLLICESNYGQDSDVDKAIKNKHMTFSQAAQIAKDGEVKELILTHFSPAIEDPEEFIHFAKDVFPKAQIGKDRMIISIDFQN